MARHYGDGETVQINEGVEVICLKSRKPIPYTEGTGTIQKINPKEWDLMVGYTEYLVKMDYNNTVYTLDASLFHLVTPELDLAESTH